MFIKLLCIDTTTFKEHDLEFTVKEGDIVSALIDNEGIRFEYEKDHYSLPYYFSDVEEHFISAFDEEVYNKRYKKGYNAKLYINGAVYDVGDVTFKVS